ncbi:MAG TPA: adenylate/guanylate cyclase domain-containing protein [Alphaproteobacteria bacterium]|nr:adenylate/guanylate cyclase domain-containing protein [Alphaproteobacteria bacterium]
MTFDDILAQALNLLQRQGRVSYRALKRRFALDDDYLEDLKAEIIKAQRLAVDEDGEVLVWIGTTAGSPPPSKEPMRALPASMPPHLAEKILTVRSALEGERKQVTVMFADLKASMELLADRDPEEARQLLDPVLERMMAAVHRYEGTVNQVMGDGIMALFGAPIAHEDHAVRACYAALAMQEAIRRYSEAVRREHGLEVQIRVGLNSGEVVVRAIGNDLHMDYSAIGQTTHLAARMEQLAPPGTVRLTADTLRLAEGWVQVTPLGPVPVKGLPAPVEVFELVGAVLARTRLQALSARGLTPFVGRQAELAVLHQALQLAAAGHGQVVAVVGEPGVGKTRLFHEFTQGSHTQGWLLLESRSTSYGKATPYLPVIDLLKAYFRLEDRDDARRMREKLTGRLLTLDPALGPTLPAFLALLEVPAEDTHWQALDPSQRRQRTQDALKRLFLRESQVQPVLVVFENLNWIDAETQAFLDSLVESLPAARLLLLVNYRPEYQHGWRNKTYYTQLRLDPLPAASAEVLLQNLLGNDAGLGGLKERLIERTQGNPFFLEESVRTLVETQVLVGSPGAYRLVRSLPNIQVPSTVQAVLAARIDRLPPEEKQLLQTAAVIGTELPLALLQAIAEVPEEALRLGLTHLQAAEFLYETRLFPEHEYTFKHALTQQVAYETLLQERRRALHGRIVEAFEGLDGDRVAEQVERLAHHALRGEVWDKALAYCRQAGERALARSAYHEAVGYFEQALNALSHLPEQRDTLEQGIDLRLGLRSALLPSGDSGRILAVLREAEALAASIDDPRRLGQISGFLSVYFRNIGDYEQSIAAAQRALGLATAGGDAVVHALANLYLGAAHWAQGDYLRAIDCLKQTVGSLHGTQRRERLGQVNLPAVQALAFLAACHAELGRFTEGSALGQEGLQIAEAVTHPSSLMWASYGVGLLSLCRGDLHKALPQLERAMSICQEADLRLFAPRMAAALGAAYTLCGRAADAVALLTQVREQTTAPGMAGFQALCCLRLGEAQMQAGHLEEAYALATHTLKLTRAHHERANEAYALRLLGDIAAQRQPPQGGQASQHYRQALAQAQELGMRPLQAHCHFGLGKLYTTIGRRAEASAELSAAIELYRAMEMTLWLTPAESALLQVEKPMG